MVLDIVLHQRPGLTSQIRVMVPRFLRTWKRRVGGAGACPPFLEVPFLYTIRGLSLKRLSKWGGSFPWVTRTWMNMEWSHYKITTLGWSCLVRAVKPLDVHHCGPSHQVHNSALITVNKWVDKIQIPLTWTAFPPSERSSSTVRKAEAVSSSIVLLEPCLRVKA